jgi:hypothetical protein
MQCLTYNYGQSQEIWISFKKNPLQFTKKSNISEICYQETDQHSTFMTEATISKELQLKLHIFMSSHKELTVRGIHFFIEQTSAPHIQKQSQNLNG